MIALLTLLLAAAPWTAKVTIPAADLGSVQIELKLDGQPEGEQVSLCFGRSRIRGYTTGLPNDPKDEDCLLAEADDDGVVQAKYQLDLHGLCGHSHDPDDCSHGESGVAMTDKALIALPNRGKAALRVEFALPEGLAVAAPWERVGTAGFATTASQVRAGSYLAIGKLSLLAPIEVEGGAFQVAVFATARRSTDAGVRAWLELPARASAHFWGGLGTRHALLILAPAPGSDRGGIFGSVLHTGVPSAVLYFGAEAKDADLPGGWVAFHELFHAGQPSMARRTAWFIEGTATYYQDVLRARTGARTAQEMWSDLGESLLDHCAPQDGMSLMEESRELRRTHNYPHVYWMGACTAFRLDLRMRELSAGKKTLDDALRALAAAGRDRDLTEDEVLKAFDATSGGLASELVHMTKDPRPIKEELLRLGVEMHGEVATLHDDAPLAALRRAIF